MQTLKAIWDFFQSQLLGMKWLNDLISRGLNLLGFDTTSRWIGSVQFFIYDVIKITLLLCFLRLGSYVTILSMKINTYTSTG
jgi:hypothetical protein